MRLFGRSKKKQAEGPQGEVLQMRSTLEMLEKKEKYLDNKIAEEAAFARKNAVEDKPSALAALKRKKMYAAQRDHARGARLNLELQLMNIESANLNVATIKAMEAGSVAMKSLYGELNVEKVDSTMDKIREQNDLAAEVNVAISTPLGNDYGVDEDELNEELEQLEQSELDRVLLDVKTPAAAITTTPHEVVKTPPPLDLASKSKVTNPISASNPPSSSTLAIDEEAELEQLRASMAL